ncbi:NAD(P)/FAD-dependent oxidoreductase [Streptosporangium sp. CA-115845]|uniref:NAD(P)/FAD-dependent oxidoreductase n=1 Tax=Streptosporangium sp. CA-115845 TaxID=3240071 RepID=UPI003D912EFD
MSVTADVVVVGAGVIGSSIAFELAKTGRSVVVVDKASGPGQGSTSASSAVIRFNYSTWDGIALSWESKHCWERWADHLEGVDDAGMARFHRVGKVFMDVDIAPMGRVLEMFDRAGIPYEVWGADELARRMPGLAPGRFWPPKRIEDPAFWEDTDRRLGALWTPDAGFVDDPGLAAVNLANGAKRRGARFLFRRQVIAVLGDGAVSGVRLDDGTTVSAPVVINAAGPWSGTLNALAGVGAGWSVSVRPMRQEVHHVPAPAGYNGEGIGPCIADLDLGVYMRGAPGDGLLVGGTEPACDELQWVDDPDAINPNPTQQVFEAQVTRAARRLPDLGVPGRPIGIAGVYDVAEDWTPIYDGTERAGFYVAIGTSGNQFKNAPMVGRLMRAVIDGESRVVGEHTGLEIGLAAFGRARPRNADSTGTVMG